MQRLLKRWILPIAMIIGVIFHEWIDSVRFLTPYLIFLMLVITYSRVSLKEFKITRFHWCLLLIQLVGCWMVYFLTYWINPTIAGGGFLCVFVSTATAAPVIAGMLGGNVPRIATYSLLSNVAFAFCAPFFLPSINSNVELSYTHTFIKISTEVLPILVLPVILALLIRYFTPKINNILVKYQASSFYIWSIALLIVIGSSINFIIKQSSHQIPLMIGLSVMALIVCCAQFYIGRKVGRKFSDDPVAGGQGLGQKNTILAIWIALTYLNPIVAVAPAAYVAWQNIINTIQLNYTGKL